MAKKAKKAPSKKPKGKKSSVKKAASVVAKRKSKVKSPPKKAKANVKATSKRAAPAKKSGRKIVRRAFKAVVDMAASILPTSGRNKTEGERPEALAKFAEVARNDDGRPVRDGTQANSENAPIPTDLELKQDAATKVLREGVLKRDQGADEAIEKLPDRTDTPGQRS